jgi:hypothetical protein
VITWNLGFWQHRSRHDEAWAYMRTEIKLDLALLQEKNHEKEKARHVSYVPELQKRIFQGLRLLFLNPFFPIKV